MTTDYSLYDAAGRLREMKHLDPTTAVLESLTYSYDRNGNRDDMARPLFPLPNPAPVAITSHNAANQMLTFNAAAITYDDNGNMKTVTNSCGITTYTWDVRNRLVGINGYDPNCAPVTAAFKCDALGRRIEKTINGRTIQYLYDGLDIVQEKENGQVAVNYIRTLSIDEPLARIEASGKVRYYHTDALGSVIALTAEAGAVRTQYAYDPFGKVTVYGESSDNPFQYTRRENDGTGLYYYQARYYNPDMQRFISEDSIGRKGGINFHAYVANRPTNLVDPRGFKGCGPGDGWGDRAVPDQPYGIDFLHCCDKHDECYRCDEKTFMRKMLCDLEFCACLFSTYIPRSATPPLTVIIYCNTVALLGFTSF